MNIKIEPMTVNDSKSVAEIHTQSWQSAYKGIIPQEFLDAIDVKKREENWARGIIKDPGLIRLVAKDDNGSIIGFLCGLHNRDKNPKIDGELWAIYVYPEQTKRGVGKLLFNSFVNELRKRSFSKMNVWVLEKNSIARIFYEKMGGALSEHKKEIEIGGKKLIEVSYEYRL